VVAFDSGGISDWLNTGISGFLAPAADIDAMASSIQKLLGDVALARKMGQAATKHVRQSFSHRVYLDQVTEQLENIR
jgi:glycosyltransferase involved in cell wall biosynthesis